MRKIIFFICSLLLGLITVSTAQFSHQFTQIANVDENDINEAEKLFRGNDDIIFLANGPDGLRAYTFSDTTFINVAHINEGGSAMSVFQAEDGTVFLANGEDGLRAYSFDGTSFTNLAHISNGGTAMDVAVSSDGTVFLANGHDGLRAYNFDGSSFEETAHVDDDDQFESRRVAIHPDGTVFLVNRSGYWAYEYNENSFSKIWNSDPNPGASGGIAFGADGSIFISQFAGVLLYNKEGTNLAEVARLLFFDIWPYGLTVTPGNTIFIAGKASPVIGWGVSALLSDGDSLIHTAHFPGKSVEDPIWYDSRDVVALSEDTLLVASGRDGIIAYTYTPSTPTAVYDEFKLPAAFHLEQNYPNPFNPATTINYELPTIGYVELKIYNTLGQEIRTLVNWSQPAGTHQVMWDGRDDRGHSVSSGLYFYRLKAGSFVETRKMILVR